MSVPAAYIGVIFIWSTTPLAVQWSNSSLSPIAAVTSRMGIACVVALLILMVVRRQTLNIRRHWRSYGVASLGLFPNMPLVYWAAEYITSGLISLLFALSPFVVALMSHQILGDNYLSKRHYVALFISLIGLMVIVMDQLRIGENAVFGMVLMMLSTLLFSLSSVLLKRGANEIDSFNQMTGALVFCLPSLLLTWFLVDGQLPQYLDVKSAASVLYLALVGSLIGFMAYFYLLKHLAVKTVSLIPLITPVFAICLGALVNHESVGMRMIIGSVLVIAGLGLFNENLLMRKNNS